MAHLHHHAVISTLGHSSTPAPPHQFPAILGPHSHGSSADMSMMTPMTFYFGYKNVELLFAGLVIDSAAAMAVAFVAVFLLAMGYEGLRRAREGLRAQSKLFPRPDGTCPKRTRWQHLLSAGHLVQTVLHMLQVVLSYLLMLTTMTYNAYLCLAVVAGVGTGYWLFGQKAEDVDSQNHDMNRALHQEGRGSSFTLDERVPPTAPASCLSHEALQ